MLTPDPSQLRRALDTGSLGDVADALLAMAPQPCTSIDALRAQLAEPKQRAALDLLQQARWADGDGRAARATLREAFAERPRWRAVVGTPKPALLPPLYPER